MQRNQLSFILPVFVAKQNKRFVAYASALDLSTCGKTKKEVKTRFIEMVTIFLEEMVEAKTVDDVFSEFQGLT